MKEEGMEQDGNGVREIAEDGEDVYSNVLNTVLQETLDSPAGDVPTFAYGGQVEERPA